MINDLPSYLKYPSEQALEVFAKAHENHKGDMPFDGRLIPNQWLLNERAISAKLGSYIDELENDDS